MAEKKTMIIGGGIAGLTAATALARINYDVELVESGAFLGGHVIQYTCKATDTCVKCGACLVTEKLKTVRGLQNVRINTACRITDVSKNRRFKVSLVKNAEYIDPQKCSGCGICFDKCPVEGAVSRGASQFNHPNYAIRPKKCLHLNDTACAVCVEKCPENAIDLRQSDIPYACTVDAVIVATGFQAFNPVNKPYGYQRFKNVITSLELENILKTAGQLKRPSDGKLPDRIGFIQCVGSRDAALNHLWCSQACCASALRMARLIKKRQPKTQISFFYIDVQTFGKDFHVFYPEAQKEIKMVRSIPGDIFLTKSGRLNVNYFDPHHHTAMEEQFDIVILSVGITPGKAPSDLSPLLGTRLADTGFFDPLNPNDGLFIAGTAANPMTIADTIRHAENAAWNAVQFLKRQTS